MLYAVEAKAEKEEEPYQRSRHSYPSVGGRRKRVRMPQRSTERTGTTLVHLIWASAGEEGQSPHGASVVDEEDDGIDWVRLHPRRADG